MMVFQKDFTRFVQKRVGGVEIVYESAEYDASHSNIDIPDI